MKALKHIDWIFFCAIGVVILLCLLLLPQTLIAGSAPPSLEHHEMREILDLAKRIHKLQPGLDEGKYLEYATGIYRATKKFDIDPDLLIAITKQETGFRENLPEGAAGEIGICQIRKMWIAQSGFRASFPKAKTKDLHRPAKSFLYAAWILNELKKSSKQGMIPYWSFYNARKLEPRIRYYTAVNRHLSALNQEDEEVTEATRRYNPGPSAQIQRPNVWTPDSVRYVTANNTEKSWGPETIRYAGKKPTRRDTASYDENSYIANALKKLQQRASKNSFQNGAIMQAASDFNIHPEKIAKD